MNYKTPLDYYEKAIEELRSTQEELQKELEIIKEIQAENFSLKAELKNTKQRLEELENNTEQKIQQVKDGIKNGSIVAKKAVMLRARDDKHWMEFKYLKSGKYDTFLVHTTDDTWYHSVRVGAADKLRD
ncbi:hypothetical protein [Calothrix sp. CCY 0018]|uniref:hypothetical protein n=1 Tax=Calothrix sp. CCY 0018 TaxID=3103864 RepID=UPI0039C6143C